MTGKKSYKISIYNLIFYLFFLSNYQGNYVGATEDELKAMEPDVLKSKVARARKLLFECGCHFVIDTVVELPEVIEEINRRLALGIAP